jgi:RNA polymerase sigma factor (sigma-70 family)
MHAPGSGSTRSELLEQAKNWEDQSAWEKFCDLYRRLIHAFSIRSGLTDDEAQEVAQDILLEVAVRLKNGEYQRDQGSFRGWLFRLTRWRITNQFHQRQSGHVSLDQPGVIEAVESASAGAVEDNETWEEEWQRALLAAAFERLRGCMNIEHFQVLHALVWHGWSPEQVAKTFKMSRTAVYLVKLRCLSRLKRQIARLQKSSLPEHPNIIPPNTPPKTARRKK